jgi:hypothetical protein
MTMTLHDASCLYREELVAREAAFDSWLLLARDIMMFKLIFNFISFSNKYIKI